MGEKSMPAQGLPWSSLPLAKDGPRGNAWGRWGPDDQLGTLNFLTDEVVARAAKESIQTGTRVSLNWSMMEPAFPKFPRGTLQRKTINKAPMKIAHDDEWTFNSQCSSQWDGLRHYAYQHEKLYYMGRTAEEFAASEDPNGIQHVSKKGIAGRAVFIDWYDWAQKQGKPVDAMSNYAVPFHELLEALEAQHLHRDIFRAGDILIIRFGYLAQYENLPTDRAKQLDELYQRQKPENIGIEPSREFLEFLWSNNIAAVAGDSRSFEVWPCQQVEWHLHEWLLAGWGMPIGELFYLEELSALCAETGRYTFFLASSPMNVPGAVASPPNALALF